MPVVGCSDAALLVHCKDVQCAGESSNGVSVRRSSTNEIWFDMLESQREAEHKSPIALVCVLLYILYTTNKVFITASRIQMGKRKTEKSPHMN